MSHASIISKSGSDARRIAPPLPYVTAVLVAARAQRRRVRPRSMPPRQADATGSIVRVWLRADDNPERVGHLALITKSSPEQGLYAKLCTTGVAHETWLPHEQKSILWD